MHWEFRHGLTHDPLSSPGAMDYLVIIDQDGDVADGSLGVMDRKRVAEEQERASPSNALLDRLSFIGLVDCVAR